MKLEILNIDQILPIRCLLKIKQESFLEDINNLLNAGEVPNLYPSDEKADICEKMRQLDRFAQSYINAFNCYITVFNHYKIVELLSLSKIPVCRFQNGKYAVTHTSEWAQ